jgi:hypothetical protein
LGQFLCRSMQYSESTAHGASRTSSMEHLHSTFDMDSCPGRGSNIGGPITCQGACRGTPGCSVRTHAWLPILLHTVVQSLRSYSSKCISSTFRRWMKAFRWGVDQRAKGRLKLGLVLRTRFKEKFRLKFQMWARWAFFTRARRLHTPLPVFTDHLPFWTSWIAKKMRKLMWVFPKLFSMKQQRNRTIRQVRCSGR